MITCKEEIQLFHNTNSMDGVGNKRNRYVSSTRVGWWRKEPKKVAVDGYFAATNCVEEFYGCNYHGSSALRTFFFNSTFRSKNYQQQRRDSLQTSQNWQFLTLSLKQRTLKKQVTTLLKCGSVNGRTFSRNTIF